jgi:beta-N-acetylhexosaminidase
MTTQISFENLTLNQKIGQLFFIGLPGTEIDAKTSDLLEKIAPGGVCLFSRNIRAAGQTRELLNNLREVLPVEPFLSLDQEGGLVDRLRRVITPMPSAQSFTEKGNSETVEKMAEMTAEAIRILGFNMNFAPVVDVIDEQRSKFVNGLYSRGFGKSREDVVRLASGYLETLQNKGCLATIKHFPGYGATETDSHEQLPTVNLSKQQLFETDLFPYFELFKSKKVFAVMVGHAAYPLIDLQEKDAQGRFLPSSLSRNFVSSLLRKELGFQNLILTDDLEMGAIMENYGIGEAAKMALRAGNDFLLICADTRRMTEAFDSVKEAVESGEISESRINESLERIAKIKSLLQPPLPFDETRLRELSDDVKNLIEIC